MFYSSYALVIIIKPLFLPKMNDQLSNKELARYSRHIIIPEFNIDGQKRLKKAKVLVVGTGGLGAPVLQYLTAAGIGTIGVIDFDVVEESNLQRQVLFTTEDIGRPKVEVAVERLKLQNPHVIFNVFNKKLTSENALEIIQEYDIVADGTDNFPTRYLVNDACVKLGKVNVFASIFRFEGQLSVFNYKDSNGEYGPNFRDLFPKPPPPGLVPSCAEGGVLGVLPGIMGSLQANEVIKIASGVGEPLSGRLFVFDAASFDSRTLKIRKNTEHIYRTENAANFELIDYDEFCGLKPNKNLKTDEKGTSMKEITVKELKAKMDAGEDFQLIDVREPFEVDICQIGGELMPKGEIMNQLEKISRDKEVIVLCRSGGRSGQAIQFLEMMHGFDNLYNLKGGILAWSDEIDSTVAKY